MRHSDVNTEGACPICLQPDGKCLGHCKSFVLERLAIVQDSQGSSIDKQAARYVIDLFSYAERALRFPESLKDYPLAYQVAMGARSQIQRQIPIMIELEVPCDDPEEVKKLLEAAEHIHAQLRAYNFSLTHQG